MNVLVDTHAMLWFVAGDKHLSADARATIADPGNTCYVSIASWWEIAIKQRLGKLRIDLPLKDFIAQRVDEGFRILTIETEHLPRLTQLPFHHRDPFDRLIISQAMAEDMAICTSDEAFTAYNIRRIW